jgi:hypothetical protein
LVNSGHHALCLSERGRHVQADPLHGCVFGQREAGSDDEPEPPPGFKPTAAG